MVKYVRLRRISCLQFCLWTLLMLLRSTLTPVNSCLFFSIMAPNAQEANTYFWIEFSLPGKRGKRWEFTRVSVEFSGRNKVERECRLCGARAWLGSTEWQWHPTSRRCLQNVVDVCSLVDCSYPTTWMSNFCLKCCLKPLGLVNQKHETFQQNFWSSLKAKRSSICQWSVTYWIKHPALRALKQRS